MTMGVGLFHTSRPARRNRNIDRGDVAVGSAQPARLYRGVLWRRPSLDREQGAGGVQQERTSMSPRPQSPLRTASTH